MAESIMPSEKLLFILSEVVVSQLRERSDWLWFADLVLSFDAMCKHLRFVLEPEFSVFPGSAWLIGGLAM